MSDGYQGKYTIAGVGQSPSLIGKAPGVTRLGLHTTSMKNAIEDSGLARYEIEGIVSRVVDDQHTHHQHIGRRPGLNSSF